jgi:radical SAM superfamily enzyme YgiQ (UPF0313 family)
MSAILLTTLNARYIHSAFGLRYLKANMAELIDATEIIEFTINERPIDIVEKLLQRQPRIIGLGVYIWNIVEITEVAALLKAVSPETLLLLGGPEVSFEHEAQPIVQLADYVICGQGDLELAALCRALLAGERPAQKIIHAIPPKLEQLKLPYQFYTDEDIAHRIIYVEASRGCPFKCEFCLSALDKTAKPFDLDLFLEEMDQLYKRGARHFKFVDRTFNLKIDHSIRILDFFLERLDDKLFLHYEIIPDHLPEKLKAAIQRFPAGTLQFEIGVQTFNEATQALISRKQDNLKTIENLRWIGAQTHAHIHADLIIGLPGEDLASFAAGFNTLALLGPHEIQVGILKRLRGSPIIRHTQAFDMRYNPNPPYNILSNNRIDFATLQRLSRFARYWEMVANSGRFRHSLPLLLGDKPFERFMTFSDWLFEESNQTHQIALKRLFQLLYRGAIEVLDINTEAFKNVLEIDWLASGLKGILDLEPTQGSREYSGTGAARQQRHHAAGNQ